MPKPTEGHSVPQVEKISRYNISEFIYGYFIQWGIPLSYPLGVMIYIGILIAKTKRNASCASSYKNFKMQYFLASLYII